jgi:23S rRNA pseudouridine2605 synthase
MSMRLQKALAHAGVASRRASEKLIRQGRVRVNGQLVTEMAVLVDPESDRIEVDGRPVRLASKRQYFKLNKPPNVLSVMHDDRGRRSLSDLVPNVEGVHPVGRLDLHSEGLILLTDDGALTDRLTHPRYHHPKEYRVLVKGTPGAAVLRRLAEGIELEDGTTAPAEVSRATDEPWVSAPRGSTWLRFVLHEGRKRQIRRMCRAVELKVERLVRIQIASLALGDLESGAYRPLTRGEVGRLLRETGLVDRDKESH